MRIFTAALLLACSLPVAAQINSNLFTDPAVDVKSPAANVELAIPSHGEKLIGRMLLAVGDRPHPTAVMLHGFPGYEQNEDIAQALRRGGWNVLMAHYRGSWGTGGEFSFTHAIEDADTMVDFALHADAKFHVNAKQVVVIGHSMGGFLAAQMMAHHPELLAAIVISGANPAVSAERYTEKVDPADLLPLKGCTASTLAADIAANKAAWMPAAEVPKIAPRPILIVSAEDGLQKQNEALADALKKAGGTKTLYIPMRTDHAFATRRVALTSLVVDWLARLVR
ncbi:MAG: alpha/beta fold hydrolase [Acidobacteria bacterium]|nr:alpha/beta fold hydrolase [Acidobacteriota bacterium]